MNNANTAEIDIKATEEMIVNGISRAGQDGDQLVAAVQQLYDAGHNGKANELADNLLAALVEAGARVPALALLDLRIRTGKGHDSVIRPLVTKSLTSLFHADLQTRKYVASIGLDKVVALPEAMRRLHVLLAIQPGRFCIEKSWGFGVVKRIDEYAGKFIVDFEGKPDHGLAFTYAAEALQLPDDGHILVLKHRDPARLAEMVASEPETVVRLTLQSCGPMPVPILQEFLEARILGSADWKSFWEVARKRLKNDPLVEIPARRSELLRLNTIAKAYDDAWFAALERERLIPRLITLIREWMIDTKGADATRIPAITARLNYVVRGASLSHPEYAVRAAMIAEELKLGPPVFDSMPIATALFQPGVLGITIAHVAAREVRPLLDWLANHDREQLTTILLAELPEMPLGYLGEAIEFLNASTASDRVRARLREIVGSRAAGPNILAWAAKNLDLMDTWNLGRITDLAIVSLEVLNRNYSGEKLKAFNALEGLLTQKDWLTTVIGAMDELQRQAFMTRLYEIGQGHTPLDTKSIMAKVLIQFPYLAEYGIPAVANATPAARRVTAWRTLQQRHALLQKIVTEDIPRNSRDIGVARSYGDLRENFEYKTAKEQQGILLRRKAELEHDLSKIQGTDFADVPAEVAGPGTTAVLRFADGRTETYHILGEWDNDTALGIISSGSALAGRLKGQRAGQKVTVPLQDGSEVECEMTQVAPLPETVREWIKG